MTAEPVDDPQLPDVLPTQGRVLAKAATVYDAVQPLITFGQERRLNTWVADKLDLGDGSRALDVGCGTGLLTVAIAERHPSCEVVGIDASKPMLRVARRKRSRPNCSYKQAVAEHLPFDDEFFDVVTSALFFHHVNREYKARSLNEALRVLKPNGRLLTADMGRPYTFLGWAVSHAAWILLRQPEIKENIDGVLGELVTASGFQDFAEVGRFSGYITVFSARKGAV